MTTETQLPQGWETNLLKCLCSIKTGDKDVNQGNENGIYPFFTCAQEISNSDTFSFDGEAILIAGNGNFNVKFYHGKFEAYQRIYVLQSFKNINSKYLFYFIKNKLNDITKGNRGSTIKYIRLGDIANYPIISPINKETQQAIVNKIESLFAEIDAGIASLKTAQQQLKHYRQSLLKNAFNGELTKQWRLENADRLPSATELLAKIQTAREQHHAQQLADWQTAVKQWEQTGKQGKKPSKPSLLPSTKLIEKDSTIPSNWLIFPAEFLCDFITKGTTPSKNELYTNKGEIPFLKVYNLTKNGLLDFTIDPTFTSKEVHNNFLQRSKVYPNDVLMNIVGPPLGKVSIVPDDYAEWNINQAIVIYRSKFLNSKFLANYLLAEKTIKLMYSQAKTTAGQHNLTLEICRNLPIPYCSLEEQTQIVAILESKLTACDQLASELATQLKQAELLKQAVLKAAFEGKLIRDNHNE